MRIGILDSGQKIVSDGLVLHLDAAQLRSYSGSGTTWTDLSGNGNNGTLTNSPTYNSSNGGSIVFSRFAGNYVDITSSSTISFTTSCTLNVWFMLDDTENRWRGLLNKRLDSSNVANYGTNIFSNNQMQVFYRSSSGFQIAQDIFTYTVGVWYNVCGTFTQNSTNTNIVIYRNATSVSTLTGTGNLVSNSVNATVGASSPGFETLDGKIAIAQIYNRALSATEVLQNYDAVKSRFGL